MLLPLILSAAKSSWQVTASHGTKRWNSNLHAAISKKFKYTCQYCGWVDPEFNEVSHLNEDHSDHREENLVLACPLCHQCLHLGQISSSDGGKMIWAPELSQIELNHLARVYWITETDQSHPLLSSARTLSSKLEHQSHILEVHYVSGASDPGTMAEALLKMSKEEYENRGETLKNIKVWPNLTKFKKMVKPWAKRLNVNLPLKNWEQITSKVNSEDKDN